MYRFINPASKRDLPLRMLFQPTADGLFLRACEADSFRALVAAMVDDPSYETAGVEGRLMHRLRVADDAALIAAIDDRTIVIADRDGPSTINVASDEPFIRSLDRLGFVSLDPALRSAR
jgi:hypothetical protein